LKPRTPSGFFKSSKLVHGRNFNSNNTEKSSTCSLIRYGRTWTKVAHCLWLPAEAATKNKSRMLNRKTRGGLTSIKRSQLWKNTRKNKISQPAQISKPKKALGTREF
jgi:hypothetical protein